MIQVLPLPRRAHLQLHKDFHAGLKRIAGDATANYTMLEGYVAGRVMVEGLKRAGANPTRAQLLAALDGMGDLDLGGYKIRFTKDDHNGSHFVELGVVNDHGDLVF